MDFGGGFPLSPVGTSQSRLFFNFFDGLDSHKLCFLVVLQQHKIVLFCSNHAIKPAGGYTSWSTSHCPQVKCSQFPPSDHLVITISGYERHSEGNWQFQKHLEIPFHRHAFIETLICPHTPSRHPHDPCEHVHVHVYIYICKYTLYNIPC